MGQNEVDRLAILQRVQSQELSQVEASRLLKLTTRQVRRLQRRLSEQGAKGLVSKRRGRASNHRHHEHTKQSVKELVHRVTTLILAPPMRLRNCRNAMN